MTQSLIIALSFLILSCGTSGSDESSEEAARKEIKNELLNPDEQGKCNDQGFFYAPSLDLCTEAEHIDDGCDIESFRSKKNDGDLIDISQLEASIADGFTIYQCGSDGLTQAVGVYKIEIDGDKLRGETEVLTFL